MKKVIRPLGALAFLALVCLDPANAAASARAALTTWAERVAPALLPFLIAVPALTCVESRALLGRAAGGVMRALKCPAVFAPAWITGLLSGSPAGAAALAGCAEGGGSGALLRCAVASSGASPAFLLGAVGASLLQCPRAGWTLVGAQALSGFATGLLMRPLPDGARREAHAAAAYHREPVMLAAMRSLLVVGGWMALFSVLAGQLARLLGAAWEVPLRMLLELSGGCEAASSLELLFPEKMALLAAVACVGGASVCAQSLSFLRPLGVKPGAYLFWKLVQSGFCALCALLMTAGLPPVAVPADAPAAALCVLLILLAAFAMKRRRSRRPIAWRGA